MVDLHGFHVWSLSESEKAFMVHLETTGADDAAVYTNAMEVCRNYGMHFFTVQIEKKGGLCPLGLQN